MQEKYDVYIGVNPDSNLATIHSDRITCPLGQLVLASYTKERVKGLEAIVFNGSRTNEKIILETIKDKLKSGKKVAVGETILAGNLNKAESIAKKAHDLGADVFWGGTEISMGGENILLNRSYVKALVFGAGERILTQILNREPLEEIPNIAYTKKGRIRKNNKIMFELDFKNIRVDYDLLYDLKKHEGVSYLYGNDCQYAKKRCFFCGRQSLGLGFRDEKTVWQENLVLYERGITKRYNVMDNIAVNLQRFRKFAQTKPYEMRFDKDRIFINAIDITEETVQLLSHLNATAAIGFENFTMMDKVGKGRTQVIDNLRALQLCRDWEVPIFLSGVYGFPNEKKTSLEENNKWIKFIFREFGETIESLHISPLMITTGSRAYNELMNLENMKLKYSNKQIPYDPIEMSEDYFNEFVEYPRETALENIHQLYGDVKQISPRTRFSAHIHHTEMDIKGMSRSD
ncbi:hypothetical protein HQ533_03795 [Candidatus Woesearchaeota archaeon]|nr:hypothetical protein [Candidatus Woesearchaeota archaeon]